MTSRKRFVPIILMDGDDAKAQESGEAVQPVRAARDDPEAGDPRNDVRSSSRHRDRRALNPQPIGVLMRSIRVMMLGLLLGSAVGCATSETTGSSLREFGLPERPGSSR